MFPKKYSNILLRTDSGSGPFPPEESQNQARPDQAQCPVLLRSGYTMQSFFLWRLFLLFRQPEKTETTTLRMATTFLGPWQEILNRPDNETDR